MILRRETNNTKAEISANIESVKIEKYHKDDFPIIMQGALNVYIVLPMILVYLRVIFRILYEKVKKQYNKEKENFFFNNK